MAADLTITRAEVAAALDLTERTLRSWESQGLQEARTDDRSPPRYRVQPLLRFLLDHGSDTSALQRARVREVEARAAKRELEVAREQGQLIALDDMERLLREPLERVNLVLKTAPSHHGPRLAKAAGIPPAPAKALLSEIIEEMRAALRALAER